MPTCASCGQENPDGFRLCGMCGAALAQAARAEERKVVSILFVDLVGHTARSAAADPEDVRSALDSYHAEVKREIERFQGTVEKFVGDAVMAVFGAPVAREDDAERAVRAGLRVVEAFGERVRAAVNTGEALVALGARAEAGEALVAGDVVNTAARLQGAAPPGTLVAGEQTVRQTGGAIVYEPLDPVELKGKDGAVPLWRAVEARSRFGVDVEHAEAAPLVGRAEELELIRNVHARTMRDPSVQLVTLVGEPGVGKSRLVGEFRRFVDDLPDLIHWRQGRCLPYGDGITFWALGEIVKAQAGILEYEREDEAHAKLRDAVAAAGVEPSERGWVAARLGPLVGLPDSGGPTREETFTAWRRFLESVAASRPLVLVFEDLHWADEPLLEFVDHLADWATGVPLLVLCTARPELHERRPGWGGGKRNATTISLPPLSEEDTARLIAALLDRTVLPAETQRALLDRAGGNPLYAEQFVRMLADREELGGEIPIPESVQAVIAARLDTLPPERKALLQDAAVLGKVFWSDALVAMGTREPADVREALHGLVRKELVRPARRSSIEGADELSFWHLLVRDVAYGQIPRGARCEKHRAAAAWLEAMAGERVADHAELLAHHYEQALSLAVASGDDEAAGELTAPAAHWLVLAGHRAASLDPTRSRAFYGRALELMSDDAPERPDVLVAAAKASQLLGAVVESQNLLAEAVDGYRARGDGVGAGAALGHLAVAYWHQGATARGLELLDEARRTLEPLPPSEALAHLYSRRAFMDIVAGRYEGVVALAEQAVELAERLEGREALAFALQVRGMARDAVGQPGGADDLRAGVDLAVRHGNVRGALVGYVNLAESVLLSEGASAGLAVLQEGVDYATRHGARADWIGIDVALALYELGRWDEALEHAERMLEPSSLRERTQIDVGVNTVRALVLAFRGRLEEAHALVAALLPTAREIGDLQALVPAVLAAARIALERGDPASAAAEVATLDERGRTYHYNIGELARLLVSVGRTAEARGVAESDIVPAARAHAGLASARAHVAEAEGDPERAVDFYERAAAAWEALDSVLETALARLGRGRCLVATGRDGTDDLEAARATFSRLGATKLAAEAEALLSRRAAAS